MVETRTQLFYLVAPEHAELAVKAGLRFRTLVEGSLRATSYIFGFRSPMDRLGQMLCLTAAPLPPSPSSQLLALSKDLCVQDVDLLQVPTGQLEFAVLEAVTKLAERFVREMLAAEKQ